MLPTPFRVDNLSEAQVAELLALSSELSFKLSESYRRRMGDNGMDNPSMYHYSKIFDWKKVQRERFRAIIPEEHRRLMVQGYFLKLAPVTGVIDRIDQWKTGSLAGKILAYALQDNQIFYLEDKRYVLNKGEGIFWSLRLAHEIKPCADGQHWACVMVPGT